jgi:uncharacterized membrane protein YkoI
MRITLLLAAIPALAAAAAGAGAATRGTHHVLKSASLSSAAHVNLATARASALAARPGRITDQELEKERGGSGLRYSFDIVDHGKTYEVGIDAKSGRILENKAEGKNPD